MPARVAIRAARSFVTIPPVPRPEPPSPTSAASASRSATTSRRRALGWWRGSRSWSPSTSVSTTSKSASTRYATQADRVSLSPSFNSAVATLSFSFTTGTTPRRSSASSAFLAFT